MDDEAKLREKVLKQKENKAAKVEEKKRKVIEQAKIEGMTEEQRNIIADSKVDSSNLD